MITENHEEFTRRRFIYNVTTAIGAGVVLSPVLSKAAHFIKTDETYTVKQIMDLFISKVPGGVKTSTVDTLKSGSPDMVVTGIVTTMFATLDIIRHAISINCNFIIAHEPTFYNHADDTSWLQDNAVYKYKADLLKKYNITVWRNHDYIHSISPDPVTMAVLSKLGWRNYADKDLPNLITLPASTIKNILDHVKAKLNIEKLRFVGTAPTNTCTQVFLMPGAPGGKRQIEAIAKMNYEGLILCGELQEWETAEFVRDARAMGKSLSLAVLGHIASEEPGSEFMVQWVKDHFPSIRSTHIPCGNSLTFK